MSSRATSLPDLQSATRLLDDAAARGDVPGAVALVRWQGREILQQAFGWASLLPELRPMHTDTVFDLASLTKPLATTPVVLSLIASGRMGLDDPIAAYLSELQPLDVGSSTIRQLLTHTSGLPAWEPVYAWTRSRDEVAGAIGLIGRDHAPELRVEYSCLGFILLGLAAERVTGARLHELVRDVLLEPVSLADTGFGFQANRCAWTECGNPAEEEMARTRGLSFDGWRTDFYPGQVHDGNAWYAMGGVSGNAGLFGTARDVAALGSLWLDGGRSGGRALLSSELVTLATSDRTQALPDGRGLGWQINRFPETAEPVVRSPGTRLGPRAFGHTGFTGTSIWIDPDLDLLAVLLTNRVHPVAGSANAIMGLRARFHDAVVEAIRGSASDGARR